MIKKYVYLGRFSPFHLGHERLLKLAVDRFGVKNCLVLVGSSNSLNERTPYTLESRKEMVKAAFPLVEVLPLPDARPELTVYDGSTNEIWLDCIEKLAKNRNEEFVFLGGSKKDLEVLSRRFETKVMINRNRLKQKISATKIREALRMINPINLPKVINFDYQ